jgi:sigma-E factor negative regulatory protein RseC
MVVNVFDNGTAEVMTDKKTACGGCEDTRSCKSCLTGGEKVVAVVRNEAHANPGDIVAVEHTKGAMWGGAALFYVLPVVGLMAGAFAGGALFTGWGMDESGGAALFGLLGLAVGLLAVFFASRSAIAGRRLVPRIVRVAERGDGRVRTGIRRAPAATAGSCCH